MFGCLVCDVALIYVLGLCRRNGALRAQVWPLICRNFPVTLLYAINYYSTVAFSTHWSLMHQMLLNTLPEKGKSIVHYAHTITAVSQSAESVTATVSKQGDSKGQSEDFEVSADLLVAADGSMSQTRAQYVPNEPRR